jgi:hypothetical protein
MRFTAKLIAFVSLTLASFAAQAQTHYEITITNLTHGQSFTPVLVASHNGNGRIFELGRPASPELAMLAEGGATGPLAGVLADTAGVFDINTTTGLLLPGETTTVNVDRRGNADHLSLAAMLLPTNDGFVALNAAALPEGGRPAVFYALAYDSGSEVNDESCASIPGPGLPFPGPECGAGGSPGGGEGHVHVHAGIFGIDELSAHERDWKNPVARVVVRVVD